MGVDETGQEEEWRGFVMGKQSWEKTREQGKELGRPERDPVPETRLHAFKTSAERETLLWISSQESPPPTSEKIVITL